jgi:hypothetical protein
MKWADTVAFVAFVTAFAIVIASMASCQARTNEAHFKECETKSICVF